MVAGAWGARCRMLLVLAPRCVRDGNMCAQLHRRPCHLQLWTTTHPTGASSAGHFTEPLLTSNQLVCLSPGLQTSTQSCSRLSTPRCRPSCWMSCCARQRRMRRQRAGNRWPSESRVRGGRFARMLGGLGQVLHNWTMQAFSSSPQRQMGPARPAVSPMSVCRLAPCLSSL